jgi:hypothetical protein
LDNTPALVPLTHKKSHQASATKSSSAAPSSVGVGRAYERFLELPVPVVLLVTWVVGTALLGACALLAYTVISALAGMVGGAF